MGKIYIMSSILVLFGCQKPCSRPGPVVYDGHRLSLMGSNKPQNSLEALRELIESGGDHVEFDVRTTLDGVMVAIHEADLCHSTGVRGKVSGWLFDKLPTAGKSKIPRISDVRATIIGSSVNSVTVDIKDVPLSRLEALAGEVGELMGWAKVEIVMEPYEINFERLPKYCERFGEMGLDVRKYWGAGSYCRKNNETPARGNL